MLQAWGEDWRPAFRASHPELPEWFCFCREDLLARPPALGTPTLLLCGDSDPICPVAVGEYLASLLPCASLRVIAGGDHDLVETHVSEIAPLIDQFLMAERRSSRPQTG